MPDTVLLDPLGRQVILHHRTWHGHIVKGHREVAALRHLVEDTIAHPIAIVASRSDSDCRIYYGPGPRAGVMIQVIADVARGLVKTAHLARKISGGAVEWSAPTP